MSRRLIIPLATIALLVVLAVLLASQLQKRYLTGVVRDAETRAPLSDVTLWAGAAQTVSNGRGEYTIEFARGTPHITASVDGYQPVQQIVNEQNLFAQTLVLDLDLVPLRTFGYILDADTHQTLPNAPIRVGETSLNSDPRGAFELRGIKPGMPIAVSALGYQPTTLNFTGEPLFNISLIPATLTVTVLDAAGKPIASAQVQAGEQSAATDSQGRANFRRVKPGTPVRVSINGTENAGGTYTGSDLQFTLKATALDGTVTDAVTGQPISNTLVYLGTTVVATNAKGTFHFDGLNGKATLTFKAPGYRKTQIEVNGDARREVKLQPFAVKGIHVPFGMTPDAVRQEFELIKNTELNAIVISVKAEKGPIAWDSQVPLAKEIQAPYLKGIDLREVVQRCRADNIYCIARIPVFQDTRLATKRPDLALHLANGNLYMDNPETAWTNAASATVWDYNIALAKEVTAFGFDEIQFDYVRFPGRGEIAYTGTAVTSEGRIAAVTGFLAKAQKELRPTGVFVSVDVFGLTAAADDEQKVGQRLRDLGPYVDYISPMVYPDVWKDAAYLLANGLGIKNCTEANSCPYEVIYNSYKKAAEKTTAKVRPWLQAYPGQGNFGVTEYRLQKKSAEDAGSAGWLFWSGAGTYDAKTFGPP